MSTEILEYFYTTEWNLELLKNLPFKESIKSHFPLIVSSMSSFKSNSLSLTFENFKQNKKRMSPTILLDSWGGGYTRRISEYLGTTNETMIINANCSSSIYSFYLAGLVSLDKKLPVIVVCADNLNDDFDFYRFNNLGAMDNSTGIPFDSSSKGFRMGKGISVFLVKNSRVNFTNPAKACINQTAFWTNNSLTNPGTSDEIINNIKGINYNVFDFWNAHAPGTILGDRTEYEYFSKVISKDIPIVSYKTYIGHCMTASGALEIAMSLEDRENNILRPNKIKTEKIVNDDRIITELTSFSYRRMFKSTLGFGGKIAVADISFF